MAMHFRVKSQHFGLGWTCHRGAMNLENVLRDIDRDRLDVDERLG
jgi:hypothetical protein